MIKVHMNYPKLYSELKEYLPVCLFPPASAQQQLDKGPPELDVEGGVDDGVDGGGGVAKPEC